VIVGANKLGVDRERAAIGAAVIGLATAANTTGWVRGIASGVAAAGAAIAIAQRFSSSPRPTTPAKRDADANWITREELQRALVEFAERQAKAQAQALAELQDGIREVVKELGGGPQIAQAEERAVEPEHDSGLATDVERDAEGLPMDAASVEPATVPSGMSVEKFLAIASELSDDERAQLAAFIDAVPDGALRAAQEFLAQMPPNDAAQYLRQHVLRSGTA
jgi:hypothetical protein